MDGENEYYLGAVFITASSIYLGIYVSPWWLLFTIPVGLAILIHGFYREGGR